MADTPYIWRFRIINPHPSREHHIYIVTDKGDSASEAAEICRPLLLEGEDISDKVAPISDDEIGVFRK